MTIVSQDAIATVLDANKALIRHVFDEVIPVGDATAMRDLVTWTFWTTIRCPDSRPGRQEPNMWCQRCTARTPTCASSSMISSPRGAVALRLSGERQHAQSDREGQACVTVCYPRRPIQRRTGTEFSSPTSSLDKVQLDFVVIDLRDGVDRDRDVLLPHRCPCSRTICEINSSLPTTNPST
jgi:hypothetical protein